MMTISLPDWKTIRELRLCSAAGLLNQMEFKILLAPPIFLDQDHECDDEDEDEEIPAVLASKKNKKGSPEEEPVVVGFSCES